MDLFKEKVLKMTGKELVLVMVAGLQAAHLTVDMDSFGHNKEGICVGCAATNAICEISGIVFTPEQLPVPSASNGFKDTFRFQAEAIGTDFLFLDRLERAINALRQGDIAWYNDRASHIGIAQLPEPKQPLPVLETADYIHNLQSYIDYANSL